MVTSGAQAIPSAIDLVASAPDVTRSAPDVTPFVTEAVKSDAEATTGAPDSTASTPDRSVSLGFGDASDHLIEETAAHVTNNLFGSTLFPTPPLTKSTFQTAVSAFTAAVAAQGQGGTQATAAKNQARARVVALLRQLAMYVQGVLLANSSYGLAQLLASGFEAISTNRASQPLAVPAIKSIDNAGEGALTLRLQAVPNARQYEVQFQTAGGTDWQSAGLFNSTRGLTVHDLTPGGMYTFQVRAVGGSTGASGWSNAVSHRSL